MALWAMQGAGLEAPVGNGLEAGSPLDALAGSQGYGLPLILLDSAFGFVSFYSDEDPTDFPDIIVDRWSARCGLAAYGGGWGQGGTVV